MSSPTVSPVSSDDLLDLLAPRIGADKILKGVLADGFLWCQDRRVRASGLDVLACVIARSVIVEPSSVAFALPRGQHPLPVMLGLYLAICRAGKLTSSISGSIAVSTTRTELRNLASGLVFDGTELKGAIPIARLVSEPRASKRIRAAALTLDRRARKGLSPTDSFLLFLQPNRMPPVALNVISAMVCDTHGASLGSWQITHERNLSARRRQVWVGELGDADFESFCAERQIPLVRFDWPLIAAAADRYGVGSSPLATKGCCERALGSPTLGYHLVNDTDVDGELREITVGLAQMRKRGRDQPPDPMRKAWQLANLLARLAAPVSAYEEVIPSHPMSRRVSWLLERVTDSSSGSFRNRYKLAFKQHWPAVKGAARELVRTLEEPKRNAKFWALAERMLSLESGQTISVACQTRAERDALREALLDEELITVADLESGLVQIVAFGHRAPHGSAKEERVQLMLSPPSPAKAPLYFTGEAGTHEILCYPFELARLRQTMPRVLSQFAGSRHNQRALAALGLSSAQIGPADPDPNSELALLELDSYEPGDHSEGTPLDLELPGADEGFWEGAAALYDTELELDEDRASPDRDGERAKNLARLLSFIDGPPMYLAEDAECTVVESKPGAEPEILTRSPGELSAGMRIAVLPGSERGGLLAELMAAWDEGIALVRARYQPIYERALGTAIAKYGVDGVAEEVGLTAGAVRHWEAGWNSPGSPDSLRRLLELSEDEEALRNQALIQSYFNRVRGAHRHIGRVLNDAVGETVLHDVRSRESISKLEALVDRDLTDLFDATSVLSVESVSELREVPASVLGSFLDPDDPHLLATGLAR